jgi:hypothetical protein
MKRLPLDDVRAVIIAARGVTLSNFLSGLLNGCHRAALRLAPWSSARGRVSWSSRQYSTGRAVSALRLSKTKHAVLFPTATSRRRF